MPPAFWSGLAGIQADPDCLLVGTNRVLCFASFQGLQWDAMVIRDGYRDLWRDPKWGTRYHEGLWKPHPAWKVGPANERVTHCHEFVRFEPGWQAERVLDHNKEAAVMENPSVVLMAANWAWLHGCRELFLIGVDYCGRHARMIPPYQGAEIGWAGQYDGPVPERIENYFRQARQAVEAGGGKLLNLSPGTRLKSIARGAWEEVFRAP